MSTKYNLSKIKRRRCYTPQEIAQLFGINRKTCTRWMQQGLEPILPDTKPLLIRGSDLHKFLKEERKKRKQPLRSLDEFYCLACKKRVRAKKGSLDTVDSGQRIGKENRKQLKRIGKCGECGRKVNRFL